MLLNIFSKTSNFDDSLDFSIAQSDSIIVFYSAIPSVIAESLCFAFVGNFLIVNDYPLN